jgi:hypothetical protein
VVGGSRLMIEDHSVYDRQWTKIHNNHQRCLEVRCGIILPSDRRPETRRRHVMYTAAFHADCHTPVDVAAESANDGESVVYVWLGNKKTKITLRKAYYYSRFGVVIIIKYLYIKRDSFLFTIHYPYNNTYYVTKIMRHNP